jgi:hypothetical protein
MQQKIIIYTTSNNETLVTRSFAVAQKHLDTLLEKAIEGDRICQSWKIYGNQKLPNYGEWKVCECRIEKDGYFNWTHKMTDKAYRSIGDTYRSSTVIRNA